MTKKSIIVLALFALILTVVPMVSAQGDIESVCLVTDIGRVNDGTFNEFAYVGALDVTEDYDLDFDFIETESETDYEANIQTCVDEGFDIIITIGFLIQDATVAAAEANPDIYFIGIDQFLVEGPENMVGVQFREDQSGFMAGVLAALVANENDEDIVAGVYGVPVPAVVRFRNGFEQGALYINPEWELGTNILGVYADSFIDLAQGISLAETFIGEGAYVLFGAGGQTGSAAIAEAASQEIYVIGVDQDEYLTTFGDGEVEGAEYIISSAVKRVDQGVYDMVAALADGMMDEFPGGDNYLLDAAGNGVGLADAHDSDISDEVWEEVDAIFEMLIDGEVETGVDPVSGELMDDMMEDDMEMESTEEAESGD